MCGPICGCRAGTCGVTEAIHDVLTCEKLNYALGETLGFELSLNYKTAGLAGLPSPERERAERERSYSLPCCVGSTETVLDS